MPNFVDRILFVGSYGALCASVMLYILRGGLHSEYVSLYQGDRGVARVLQEFFKVDKASIQVPHRSYEASRRVLYELTG